MRDINAIYINPDDPREPDDHEGAAAGIAVFVSASLDSLPAPNGPPMAGWCPDHPGAGLLPSHVMSGAVYCGTCRKLYRAIPKWLAPMYDATSSLTTTASTGLHDVRSKLDDALRRAKLVPTSSLKRNSSGSPTKYVPSLRRCSTRSPTHWR